MNKKQGLPSSVGLGSIFSNNMKGRSGRNSQETREEMKNSYNKFNPQKLKNQNQNQNEEEEEKELDYLIEKKVGFGIPVRGSNTGLEDFFGCSVAITDNWAIVGALAEDSTADGSNQGSNSFDWSLRSSGAAYIFKKKLDETWEEVAILKASNASGFDNFRKSVAITDNWAIVGASSEDSNADGSNQTGASGSGAAYIFKNNNGTWGTLNGSVYNETQILKAGNARRNDFFGVSVAISDNWAIVGANGEDSNAAGLESINHVGSGATYIFKNNNGTWGTQNGSVYNQTQILKAGNPSKFDNFGHSVAITDNWAIVGAYGEDSNADGSDDDGASGSGAAYIFKNVDGTWGTLNDTENSTAYNQTQILKASNARSGDKFGFSVSIIDNWAIVGADSEDSNTDGIVENGVFGLGAAYIFKNVDGTWGTQNVNFYKETQYLKASNGSNFDGFGFSVSISDNWAIVGATSEDSNADGSDQDGASASGAAYIFKNNNGTWGTLNGSLYNETQMLKGNDPTKILRGQDVTHSNTRFDLFGCAVAITDNFAIGGAKSGIGNNYGDTPSTLIFNRLLDNDVWGGSTKNLGTNLVKINL